MLINRVKIVLLFLAIAGSCGASTGLAELPITVTVSNSFGVDVKETAIAGYGTDSTCTNRIAGTIWKTVDISKHLSDGTHTYHLATNPGTPPKGGYTSLSQIACLNVVDGYMQLTSISVFNGNCIVTPKCVHATCSDSTHITSVDYTFEASCT